MQEEETRLLIDLRLIGKNINADGTGTAGVGATVQATGNDTDIVRMLAAVLSGHPELVYLIASALTVNDQSVERVSDEQVKRAFE